MSEFRKFLTEANADQKKFNKLVDDLYTFVSKKIDDVGSSHKKAEKRQDVLGAALSELEDFQKKVDFILKQL